MTNSVEDMGNLEMSKYQTSNNIHTISSSINVYFSN